MEEQLQTQRTLVKSLPEVWSELSEPALLGPMLHEPFGEITITRLQPESAIEWEAEHARGAVDLEPSGFGTRVRLTAELERPPPPPRRSLLMRILRPWS